MVYGTYLFCSSGALFAWISYIAPLMSDVSGIAEKHLPYIMVLAGLGMFVGNFIGGKLTDAFSPSVIVIAVLVFQIVCMMTIYYTAANAWASLVMTFLTGVTTFALVPSLTLLLLNSVKAMQKCWLHPWDQPVSISQML